MTQMRLQRSSTQALLSAGFKFDPEDQAYRKSGNESRYTIYRLPYEPWNGHRLSEVESRRLARIPFIH